MQLTYVCAPLAVDIEGNIKRAREYCRQIRDMGGTPVSAHLMFDGVYDDNDPAQRKAALVAGLQILEICDSVIVFGGRISEGMAAEIELAEQIGIQIIYANAKLKGQCVGIGA